MANFARPSAISYYSATVDLDETEQRSWGKFSLQKSDIYHVLERQEGQRTLIYHLFVFVLTLISLVLGGISTIDEWRPTLNTPLYYWELSLSIFFTYELVLRVWSAGCRARYRTFIGRWMFITRSVILLDIVTLFGFIFALTTGLTTAEFPNLTLKLLPPLQMIRFLRVDRQLTSWKVLKDIISTHRQELTVTLVIAFMFLITGAYLVHVAETPLNPNEPSGPFRSAADTIWFSIITMTTIGFGDFYPSTFIGKMITTTVCFLGVAFWCLPSGIIGSGLAIKVQEQKRDEAFHRLVPAAATVIRNWWRLRCTQRPDRFPSTWKIYKLLQRRVISPLSTSKNVQFRRKSIQCVDDLPMRYLAAIKVFRILKYSSSCKKFHQAKNPIDLKEFVSENTQMNNRLTSSLNEIQRRLDFVLGNSRTASYLTDEQKRRSTLTARIENVEHIVNQFESKLNYLEHLAVTLAENH